MTEEMFLSLKAGDEVVLKREETGSSFTTGKIYKIREDPKVNCSLTVERDDQGSRMNGWHHQFFEPVILSRSKLYEKLNMEVFEND